MDGRQGVYFHLSLARVAVQRLWPRQSGRWAAHSLKLASVEKPHLPEGWVELKPRMSGICGSDIALLHGESSPFLAPLTSFPAVLGHEIVAERVDSGERVVVNPSLSCQARRLPLCAMCQHGQADACLNRVEGTLGAGLLLGYSTRLPGGWSRRMWAPEEQLISVPPAMPDERAVLAEPASIVLAGLRRLDWNGVRRVLVIGTGTLGLLSLSLISHLHPGADVYALARYPLQQQMAQRMGPVRVVADPGADEEFRSIVGEPWKTMLGYPPHYSRGFDLVVVTAGSRSALSSGIAWVAPGGQLLLLGGTGMAQVDWTPVWAQQVRVQGSYGYGQSATDTFQEVLSLFSSMPQPLEELVTHKFLLSQYLNAVRAVMGKSGVIKAVFTPKEEGVGS